jgi:hypothetical protein
MKYSDVDWTLFRARAPLNTITRLVAFTYDDESVDIAEMVGPLMGHSSYIDNHEYDDDFPDGALECSVWEVIFIQPWSQLNRWWLDPMQSEYLIDGAWLTFEQLMGDSK